MLTENGASSTDLAIPPTIHALLAARLDRLSPDERAVIERASVVGKEFWRSAVAELSPEAERAAVGPSLMTLARKELIEPARSTFEAEDAFKFRHILIRDAAYLGIPKETRAELHELYADWLEETAGDRAKELDEIIGYHLEQAHGFREELGPLGAGSAELATRAGERLGAAGRRAIVARGDVSAAAALISRAVNLLPPHRPERAALLTELGSALMRTGDFGRAEGVLDEALEEATGAGDRRLELHARIELEFCRSFTSPEGSALDDSSVADSTIPLLEELGDDAGLAKAWWLKSEPDVNACRWGARAEALERALEHARRAGDRTEVATMTFLHAQALYCGPTPVPEAIERCERYLAEHPGDRLLEASVGTVLAGLRAMQGEFDEARSMYSHAREIHEELGRRFRIATVASLISADIEQLAGQPDEAASILRWAYDTVNEMGAMSATATIAGFFADALALDGQNAEAEEVSRFAEEQAPATDIVTQVLWRTARARATADGEDLARQAVAISRETDYPDLEARALVCLAEVTGRGDERASLLAAARRVYEAKGNMAAAARLPAQSPAPS
jgi:tetratricopeptide (TPR) repeat protein